MAKGKRVTLWLVRQRYESNDCYRYRLYHGVCPRKTARGHWPENRWYKWLGARDGQHLFPDIRLKPGGGPVRVR